MLENRKHISSLNMLLGCGKKPNDEPNPSSMASTYGRPSLSYEQKSLRSKRREASQFSKENQDRHVAVMIDAANMTTRKQKQTSV